MRNFSFFCFNIENETRIVTTFYFVRKNCTDLNSRGAKLFRERSKATLRLFGITIKLVYLSTVRSTSQKCVKNNIFTAS